MTNEIDAVLVPAISPEQVTAMRHIEPLVMTPQGYCRIRGIDLVHPFNVSYLWNAEPVGLALPVGSGVDIITFHHYGAPALFKPSLAEVYASIMRYVRDWRQVRYFYLHSENMGTESVIDGCHWCRCTLFP